MLSVNGDITIRKNYSKIENLNFEILDSPRKLWKASAYSTEIDGDLTVKTFLPAPPWIVRGFFWFWKSDCGGEGGQMSGPVAWRAISLDAGPSTSSPGIKWIKWIKWY